MSEMENEIENNPTNKNFVMDPVKRKEMEGRLGCVFCRDGIFAEMALDLRDYRERTSPITGVHFGFYVGSTERIKEAVALVDAQWVPYFDENVRIFCGYVEERPISFCIVDVDVDCPISAPGIKVGGIGCVGTIPQCRRMGAGLRMVDLATLYLKSAGCDRAYVHYTHIEKWYGKLGYQTFARFSFRKELPYQALLDDFVSMAVEVLGERLVGVYLHGSMTMGCFHAEKSDIDLIVVIDGDITDGQKRTFLERAVELNGRAPAKGLEWSIVKREFCRPFVYPTPFELHFSLMHLNWFREKPEDYVENMKGVDKDLAAHFTVICRRGILLWGEAIGEVFGEVPGEDYADSIYSDVESAEEDILRDPIYVTLNLCRVLAFFRSGECLSKEEGGNWGLENIPAEHHGLIRLALDCYQSHRIMQPDGTVAERFAEDVLQEIRQARAKVL